MVIAYRLCSSRYPPNDGKGAARHGGRWNLAGREVIYTAESRALAALEVLVHYDLPKLPRDYEITPVRIPDGVAIVEISVQSLPVEWVENESPTRIAGEKWASAGRSAVLKVPSAVIPGESNYIINVAHPDFARIEFLASEPFRFDPRLESRSPRP